MDNVRVGRAARELRRRQGWRQQDLAAAAGVSPDLVWRLELGRLDGMPLRKVKAVFAALGASVQLQVSWRGGALDRLLDERHSSLTGVMVERLRGDGWDVEVEVSYAVYAERGSIDLLGWHPRSRSLLVVEVKTELTSVEETLRRHDVKVRLARRVGVERFGWDAQAVGRLLVLPETTTARRHVDRHGATLGAALATRGAAVREWLRHPAGPLSGVLFLSFPQPVRLTQAATTPKRVRQSFQRSRDDSCERGPGERRRPE